MDWRSAHRKPWALLIPSPPQPVTPHLLGLCRLAHSSPFPFSPPSLRCAIVQIGTEGAARDDQIPHQKADAIMRALNALDAEMRNKPVLG